MIEIIIAGMRLKQKSLKWDLKNGVQMSKNRTNVK